MNSNHTIGIHFSPQGQGIIEREHRTLKQSLKQQNKTGGEPTDSLALSLFTFNF